MIFCLEILPEKVRIILFDRKRKIASEEQSEGRVQLEALTSMIDKTLQHHKKEIHQIYLVNKTTSYTSLRVGYTTINFLGFSLNIQPQEITDIRQIEITKESKPFSCPLLPVYQNKPVITKEKSRR